MTFVEQNQEVKTFATKAPAQSLAHCVGLGGSHGRPQNSHTQVRQTLVDVLSEAAVANRSRVRSKKLAVISDITGITGLAIVDRMIAGERDPAVLAKLRDRRIKASEETIRKSLEGNWRPEHVFTLKQSRNSYRHYQEQIAVCDKEIEKRLVAFQPRVDPEQRPLQPDRKRKQSSRKKKNVNPKTGFDLRTESYKLFGVDLTQIPGLMTLILTLFSEVGRDMSRWPSAGHFVSWLALCPDNDISGGRVLWRGRRRVRNRAGHLFRLAAYSLHHDETPLGDYPRRMKSKLGPAGATTATAHKIAIIFYTMVKKNRLSMTNGSGRNETRSAQTVRGEIQTAGLSTRLQTDPH